MTPSTEIHVVFVSFKVDTPSEVLVSITNPTTIWLYVC